MRLSFSGALCAASFALITGCGDDKTVTAGADCSTLGEVGTAPSCSTLCSVTNEAFCASQAATPDCNDLRPGSAVDVCGVPLPAPEVGGEIIEIERSADVDEFGGSGPPDLGCFEESGFPSPPDTSQMATMTGIAKVFSHGCDTADLTVEAWTVLRDGSANDGNPGELVATTLTAADCTLDGEPEENEDCTEFDGQRWECRYTLEDVPTETELMVITYGTGWAKLYEYNVYVPNAELDGGSYDKDIRAIVQDDFNVIPQTAIGKSMEPGNGAVGGEVHDCGDVRLLNAIVDVDRERELTYFTDNETTPLPDSTASATSTLGLYAALDMTPGPITVAGAGVLDGKLVGVGVFKARVFPNSVTSVTFRGLRPFQLPQ
jgi:hypothetical protein